jgi:hypothetical protein
VRADAEILHYYFFSIHDINNLKVSTKQDLPSQPFFDEYKTMPGLSVKHTSSTPYFLLLIVFKHLKISVSEKPMHITKESNSLECIKHNSWVIIKLVVWNTKVGQRFQVLGTKINYNNTSEKQCSIVLNK